jgi:signal transduction histidine kinase
MTILVSASLLLPLVQVLGAIGYLALLSAGMLLLEWAGAPLIGVLGLEGEHIALDALIVGVFIIAVGALLFLAVRVILTAQDRQADALAQERRAVQLKNEFVSMVSHELRTPLTGIAGFTDTLSERWTKLPKQEVDEFLDIMGHETDHLTNLVEDILVIPRLEAGQLRLDIEEFGLAVEAHSIADILLDSAEYSISIPAGVVVAADRTRLRQILRNLVENAKKYGGDQILIDGELSAPGLYTVSVSDNGPGVDVDDQERIFGHFEQLSTGDARIQQGVGLGLPIARKLASAMGGDLWYEDRFPVGAKFCFSVQLADGDRPTEETIPHAHAR